MRARAVGALATVVVAGCQSYAPRPLESEAHREVWHARTLAGDSLEEFLERIDAPPEERDAVFDPADGLSLDEGQLVAKVFNPALRLARLRVARAAAAAEHAGAWTDPELSLEVLRVTESVPDPWVVSPGLTFSIPLTGRLAAERDLASAERGAARLAALEAEWSLGHEVARAWADWSAAKLRVEETARLVDAMGDLVRTVSELAERGEIPRTEASLFAVEEARRSNQLRGLDGEARAAEQRLRALLGLAPEAPVEFVPRLSAAASRTSGTGSAGGPDSIAARHPRLARLRQEYEVSEEALRLEIGKQVPDLALGPLFESDEGQSRVGFLGAIPLPSWSANRRGIAEARVERELARATHETTYEALVGRWAEATARAEALAEQRADMERVLVPLVDRQLADAFELMQLGEGTSLVLLESLARAHETKLDLIATRLAESWSQAEVAFLIGPEPERAP